MGKDYGAIDGVKGCSKAEIDENVEVVCYRGRWRSLVTLTRAVFVLCCERNGSNRSIELKWALSWTATVYSRLLDGNIDHVG